MLAAGGPWRGACCAGRRPGLASATQQPPLSGLLVTPGSDRGRGRGGRPRQPGGRADPDQRRALGPLRDRAVAPAPSGGAGGVLLARGRDRNPGAVSGSGSGAAVRWGGIAIKAGERLAPFSARLVPAEGASGAVLFRAGVVQPRSAGRRKPSCPALRSTACGATTACAHRPPQRPHRLDPGATGHRLRGPAPGRAGRLARRGRHHQRGLTLAGARLLPGHHLPPQRPGH